MQAKKELRLIQKELFPKGIDDSLIEKKITPHQIWKKLKEKNLSMSELKKEFLKNGYIKK